MGLKINLYCFDDFLYDGSWNKYIQICRKKTDSLMTVGLLLTAY